MSVEVEISKVKYSNVIPMIVGTSDDRVLMKSIGLAVERPFALNQRT